MDAWDMPMYPAAMVARLVGVKPTRVRRWLKGYDYTYISGPEGEKHFGHQESVISREEVVSSSYASFLDLIDLLFVKKFLDYGLSLQKIRKAFDEAQELIGGHHFAQRKFFTDGKNIYLQVRDDADALMELLSGGQWVIAPVIKHLAHQIVFDSITGFARQWYPWGKKGLIVLDPKISFGRPILKGRGVATDNIYDYYLGEGNNLNQVCEWMDLKNEEAKAAIDFEQQLLAAA